MPAYLLVMGGGHICLRYGYCFCPRGVDHRSASCSRRYRRLFCSDGHTHAALGIENRWRIASTDIDIAAQCPWLAVWRRAGPAWSFRRDKTRLLASRAVGFHVKRGDIYPRRRIRAGHIFETLGNYRASGAIASGEKVADHAASIPSSRVTMISPTLAMTSPSIVMLLLALVIRPPRSVSAPTAEER